MAARCRDWRGKLDLSGQTAFGTHAWRSGLAGGIAASAQPFAAGSLSERAQAARDKVLERLAHYRVWPARQVNEIRQEALWLAPRQVPQLAPLLARRMTQGNRSQS